MSRKKDSTVKKKSIMGTFSPRGRMFAKEPAKNDKVPRNAPCPCGSGKKFKHCCQKELGIFGRIKRFFTRSKKPKS